MSNIEVKYEIEIVAVHIKKIASARAASLSESDKSVRILRRNNYKTGVSNFHNSPRSANYRHHIADPYCVLFNKSVIPERNYASHSTEGCTGVRIKTSIKDGMGEPI